LLAESQAALAKAKAGVLIGKPVDVSEMQADALYEHRKLRGPMLAIPTRVANQATGLSRATLDLIKQEVCDFPTEMAYADFESPIWLSPPAPAEEGVAESLLQSPKQPLSEWIGENLRLPSAVSALPGWVRLWPYHAAIAEAISDPAIERITCRAIVRSIRTLRAHGAAPECDPRPRPRAGYSRPPRRPGSPQFCESRSWRVLRHHAA